MSGQRQFLPLVGADKGRGKGFIKLQIALGSLRVAFTDQLLGECGLISAQHRQELEDIIQQRPVVQAIALDDDLLAAEVARQLRSAAWLSALSSVGQRALAVLKAAIYS